MGYINSNHLQSSQRTVLLFQAVEIEIHPENQEFRYFSTPLSIRYKENNFYVVDARENEIRVFSSKGDYSFTMGKKGQGPGEFDHPRDMDFYGGKIYVLDGANRRVQILNPKGEYIGSFKIAMNSWNLRVLDENRIVLTELALRRRDRYKLVHCYNGKGELLWKALDSRISNDSVFDVLLNQVFLLKRDERDFFILPRFGERVIYHFNRLGEELHKINISDEFLARKISVPLKGGRKKELSGLCWDCDFAEGKFYILLPDYIGKGSELDLGPGKQIAVINSRGSLESMMSFPVALKLISIGKEIICAVDEENFLRIYKVRPGKGENFFGKGSHDEKNENFKRLS